MLWRFFHTPSQKSTKDSTSRQGSFRLQVVLWTLWTLVVVFVGSIDGYAEILAQRPPNTLGLVIHCTVAGLIGLVGITIIEMRLEPWRFLDDK